VDAIRYGMLLVYFGQKASALPLTDHTPTKHRRNEEIRARYAAGKSIRYLARLFDISEQRVSQILLGQRK
jgi:Mor family transcriptional regulator